MAFGFHLAESLLQLSIRADHERAPLDAHHLLAVHVLFLPDFESLGDFLFGIGEQCEVQFVFVREFLLRFGFIRRDAQYDCAGFLELLVVVTKLGRFNRSTGRIGLGKEIEDHGFALEILQRHLLAVLVEQSEVGRFIIGIHAGCSSQEEDNNAPPGSLASRDSALCRPHFRPTKKSAHWAACRGRAGVDARRYAPDSGEPAH